MKHALVVSPNWPPLSFPDMHRVRMALPYLAELGWEALILKIDPEEQSGIRDPALEATIPEGTRVWQAGCVPRRWTKWVGLNHVGIRSLGHIARLGGELIRREKPDVVFLSTTMFPLFALGRYWLRRHGIPYILDFQDPWRAGRYYHPAQRTWKGLASQALAALLEPYAVKGAAHIVCVSPEYRDALAGRYGIERERISVLPFGGPPHDFDLLSRMQVEPVFPSGDGNEHWVYVGRGGEDMAFALRAIFTALRRARDENPQRYAKVRLHFLGTDYASGHRARKTVVPIAQECGVGELVLESPARVPYFQALRSLQAADALIVPGSADSGYTASKIYPYILAKRPLLAVFHERSSVVEVLRSTGAGTLVTFASTDSPEQVSEKIVNSWFQPSAPPPPATDWSAFEKYGAREMTRALCGLFDAVAAGPRRGVR